MYIMRRYNTAVLSMPLLIHIVGGASKVFKGFQLEQMQLFNSVEVIHMAYILSWSQFVQIFGMINSDGTTT